MVKLEFNNNDRPTLGVELELGLVDDVSDLDAQLQVSTLADLYSNAGNQDISLTNGSDKNYEISSLTNGTFVITKAPLSVTAENKTKVYGDINPELTILI